MRDAFETTFSLADVCLPEERTIPVPTMKSAKLLSRLAVGAAAAAVVGLSGCSAGQVTQTDTQVPPVDGTNASIVEDDINIAVRDVVVHYSDLEGYPEDGDAPLEVFVFNNGTSADTLESVSADVAESVTLVNSEDEESPADDQSPSEGTDDPSEGATGDESQAEDPQQGQEELSIELAPGAHEALLPDREQYLQLTGLSEALKPGSTVKLRFVFEKAGEVTMTVPMGTAMEPGDRDTADLDEEH